MLVYSVLNVCYFIENLEIKGIGVYYLQTYRYACPLTPSLVQRADFEDRLYVF